MMSKQLAVVMLVATLAVSGCAGQSQPAAKAGAQPAQSTQAAGTGYDYGYDTAVPPAPATTVPQAPATAAATPSGVIELTVKLTDYAFEPANLLIPLGAKVRLTVINEATRDHDFNIIGGPGVEGEMLAPSKIQVIEFTADKAGEFEIVCSQRGHKSRGMVGKLIVK